MGINNVRQPAKDEQLSPALHIAAHSTPIPQTVARATTIPLLTSASGKETSNAIHSVPISNDCAMQLDLERSIRRFARYGQVYADSPKSHIHVEQKPLGEQQHISFSFDYVTLICSSTILVSSDLNNDLKIAWEMSKWQRDLWDGRVRQFVYRKMKAIRENKQETSGS